MTERLTIRPAAPEDAAVIAAIYAPYVTDSIVSFETEPPAPAAMAERMAAIAGDYPWLVAADDGDAMLGYAYAGPFHRRAAYRFTVETTIYLAAAAQGRGIGRRLYGTLLDTLIEQGFTQAVALISLPNPASERLHAALGFQVAGTITAAGYKHGRWVDVSYWQRALAAPDEPPSAPRSFAETGIIEAEDLS